jgi:hypothetical protein
MFLKIELPHAWPLDFEDFKDLCLINRLAAYLKSTAWSHLHGLGNNLFTNLAGLYLAIGIRENLPQDRNGRRQTLQCCGLPFRVMRVDMGRKGMLHATVEKALDFVKFAPPSDYRTTAEVGRGTYLYRSSALSANNRRTEE